MGPIAVVDYGMGNLRSVQKGIERSGHAAQVTDDPDVIDRASGIVLPGVGAFAKCMENLTERGLVPVVRRAVESGKPFLGICLGFQILFESSEEFGESRGFGFFRGRVLRFPDDQVDPDGRRLQIPHMGWNRIHLENPSPVLDGVEDDSFVYFVHSYYVTLEDSTLVSTTTHYGQEFVSSVCRGNLFACQFHPEKSQMVGLRMLANFARQCASLTGSV